MLRRAALVVLVSSACGGSSAAPPRAAPPRGATTSPVAPPAPVELLVRERLRRDASLAFVPGGRLIASLSTELRLFDAETGEMRARFPHCARNIAFRADGQQIAVGGCPWPSAEDPARRTPLYLWRLETGQVQKLAELGDIDDLLFLRDGSTIGVVNGQSLALVASEDGSVAAALEVPRACSVVLAATGATALVEMPVRGNVCGFEEERPVILDLRREQLWTGANGDEAWLAPSRDVVLVVPRHDGEQSTAIRLDLPSRERYRRALAARCRPLGWSPSGRLTAFSCLDPPAVTLVDEAGRDVCRAQLDDEAAGIGGELSLSWATDERRFAADYFTGAMGVRHSSVWRLPDCNRVHEAKLSGVAPFWSADLGRRGAAVWDLSKMPYEMKHDVAIVQPDAGKRWLLPTSAPFQLKGTERGRLLLAEGDAVASYDFASGSRGTSLRSADGELAILAGGRRTPIRLLETFSSGAPVTVTGDGTEISFERWASVAADLYPWALQTSEHGGYIKASTKNGVALWDARTGKLVLEASGAADITVSPEETRAAMNLNPGDAVALFELPGGSRLGEVVLKDRPPGNYAARWSPAGGQLAVPGAGIVDDCGRLVHRAANLADVPWTADGNHFITGDDSFCSRRCMFEVLHAREASTGRIVHTFRRANQTLAAAGDLLLTLGRFDEIRLWRVGSWEPLLLLPPGTTEATLSSDGRFLFYQQGDAVVARRLADGQRLTLRLAGSEMVWLGSDGSYDGPADAVRARLAGHLATASLAVATDSPTARRRPRLAADFFAGRPMPGAPVERDPPAALPLEDPSDGGEEQDGDDF